MNSRPTESPQSAPGIGKPSRSPTPTAPTRRMGYERRITLWLILLALPSILLAADLTYRQSNSLWITMLSACVLAALWGIAAANFFEQLVRPLQTLGNVVGALREDDFSFRARGARRGDSLGDLAFEINALASTLQQQRSQSRDAITLVEQVMTSMQSPVLAFDPEGRLCLINSAAEDAFHLKLKSALGHSAEELDLTSLLHVEDEGLYSTPQAGGAPSANARRWSARRTTFRLHGVPHTLLVLADVAAVLREEERVAWQRLVRVLSHEINNSLTPIKSLAGSLRARLSDHSTNSSTIPAGEATDDFRRGLTVIEERAASLNRFLQAYQQLTHLPSPRLERISISKLLQQIVHLETRLQVELEPGPPIELMADPDQLQQLLINLIRNAVEAALSQDACASSPAHVSITWRCTSTEMILAIYDNGPGLTNPANLFVPFYTTKPEGSGIGLVVAQQIAAAHKGSVSLMNNETAPGCTAELRLPSHRPPSMPNNF